MYAGPGGLLACAGRLGRMGYTTAILEKLDEQSLRAALEMAYGNALPKPKAKPKTAAGKPAAVKAPEKPLKPKPAKPAGKK
mgnify:CR=1 FL=1